MQEDKALAEGSGSAPSGLRATRDPSEPEGPPRSTIVARAARCALGGQPNREIQCSVSREAKLGKLRARCCSRRKLNKDETLPLLGPNTPVRDNDAVDSLGLRDAAMWGHL